MRTVHILAGLLLLAVVTSPVLAIDWVDNGTFGGTTDYQQDFRNYSATHSGSFNTIRGLYFAEIENFQQFNALKLHVMPSNKAYWAVLNTTVNDTWVNDAVLKDGYGRTISTGTYGFSRSGTTGEYYIYYFPNTWNILNLTGAQNLNMTYNISKFDIRSMNIADFGVLSNGLDAGFSVDYAHVSTSYNSQYYFYTIEYTDFRRTDWDLYRETTESIYYNVGIKRVFGSYFVNSRIKLSVILNGSYYPIYDDENIININITGIHPASFPILLEYWVHDGAIYDYEIIDIIREIPGSGDLFVYTYDGSKNSLMDGVLVTMTGIDDPTWSGFAYSGATGYSGRSDFVVISGDSYRFSAAATGYDTVYVNYTVTSFPAILKLTLFPNLGYSTLEFYVLNQITGWPISGVPVNIKDHDTGAHKGMLTASGFARFNTTEGHAYDWDVAKGMGECDTCYVPVSGNTTAESGPKRITVYLNTWGNTTGGGDWGDNEIDDPHAAAKSVMELIYGMLPALLMIVFLMLFVGVMDNRRRR